MKRNPLLINKEGTHTKVGLGVGPEGQYFVDGDGFRGQDEENSVVDFNQTPSGQPSLWCQWVPTTDGTLIEWDGGEKFYSYEEWIEYIIEHFLKPWGKTLNGEVEWFGEDSDDRGLMVIEDNVLTIKHAKISYE